MPGAKAWVLSLKNSLESGCNIATCFGVTQMWVLQPISHVTSRVLIIPICEMETAMSISKDHGGDSIAIRAMKIL